MTFSRILLAALVLLGLATASPAPAQTGTGSAAPARPAGSLTAADIERLTSLLQDEARRAEFLRTLEALATAQRAHAGAAGEGSVPPPVATVPAPGGATAPGPAPDPAATAPAGTGASPSGAARPAPPVAAEADGAEASPPAAPRPAAPRPAAPAPAPSPAAGPAPAPAGAPAAPAAASPSTVPSAAAPAPAPGPAAAAAPGAEAPAPADPLIAPNTLGAQLLNTLSGRMATVGETLLGAARSMADLPAVWTATAELAQDPVARARLLDVSWKLGLLIGGGLLVEWLLARALARSRQRLERPAARDSGGLTWFRRLALLVGRLALDLVPIAGFALTVYGLFGLVQPLPTTRRVGEMVANTYILARTVFAVAHLLLSPRAPQLRLVRFSDAVAAAFIAWLRRVMLVGVGGYALAEAGLFLGLPWAAYDAIINLTLLAISLFMVRIVLQQRRAVAAVLQAPPLAPGEQPDRTRLLLRTSRDRLAEVWHVLVILWLVAGWAVWALALENGFQRLLSGTLLTLLVLVLAKVLDEAVGRLMEHALHPGPELSRRYPGLQARAAFYVPILRTVVSVAIGFGTLVLLLETWGLESLAWFSEGTLGSRLLATLASIGLTLVMALVVWEAANSAIQRRLTRLARDSHAARSARVRTLLPMLRTVIGVVILVFVVLNSLAQLGVNVAPLLAGAGVIGLAIGFGSQTLVRDVITGGFLLLEDAVAVGDSVSVGGKSGVVEHLSIRSIKLRDGDGSVHIVPFSAVTTVTNSTRDFAFAMVDIMVAYGTDTDRAGEVMREIVAEMRGEPRWQTAIRDEFDLWGVDSLGQVGVQMRGRVRTEPTQRWPVQRELMRRLKLRFEELGIEIPHQTMLALDRDGRPVPPVQQQAAQ